MAKKSSGGRTVDIEIQRGPISMDAQYGGKFQREPEMTMNDIRDREMRVSGQTLTLHQPKR